MAIQLQLRRTKTIANRVFAGEWAGVCMHRGSRYVAGLCAAATAIALSGYGVRADVPQVPTGTWASAGLFGDIPADAASAVLPNGRLVVSGGLDGNGQPLALTAIYDPAFQTWVRAGDMSEARACLTRPQP